jgi:ABC-type transport system involved in multi-copper enzyme maturation permease subunit
MLRSARWEPNPIIVKELRSRMRGGRAFITLTVALILLALAGYALYRMAIGTNQYSATPLSPLIGQVLFTGLIFIELMIVAAVTPAVTAAAVSGEIEKQTYEMLLATPLPPGRILVGKLISALGYVFILIFAGVPLVSLVFLFGGVAVREMIKALLMLIVIAVMFGVIGLFTSTAFKRSGRATAAAYLITLAMLFGPLFVAVGVGIMRQTDPPRWIMIPSPLSALGSTLSPSVNPSNLSGMFWMLGSPIYWIFGAPQISMDSIPRPLYHYSLPLFLGLTLILYLIASRLVRPARRWEMRLAELLLALTLILGFVGLTALGFAATANRYENIIIETPIPVDAIPAPGGVSEPPVILPGPANSGPAGAGEAYPPAGSSSEAPTPTPAPYATPAGASFLPNSELRAPSWMTPELHNS